MSLEALAVCPQFWKCLSYSIILLGFLRLYSATAILYIETPSSFCDNSSAIFIPKYPAIVATCFPTVFTPPFIPAPRNLPHISQYSIAPAKDPYAVDQYLASSYGMPAAVNLSNIPACSDAVIAIYPITGLAAPANRFPLCVAIIANPLRYHLISPLSTSSCNSFSEVCQSSGTIFFIGSTTIFRASGAASIALSYSS